MQTDNNTTYRLLYDATLKRPGCVLLQAIAGTDQWTVLHLFPSETWLIAPTPDMKVYVGGVDLWKRVAHITRENMRSEGK